MIPVPHSKVIFKDFSMGWRNVDRIPKDTLHQTVLIFHIKRPIKWRKIGSRKPIMLKRNPWTNFYDTGQCWWPWWHNLLCYNHNTFLQLSLASLATNSSACACGLLWRRRILHLNAKIVAAALELFFVELMLIENHRHFHLSFQNDATCISRIWRMWWSEGNRRPVWINL